MNGYVYSHIVYSKICLSYNKPKGQALKYTSYCSTLTTDQIIRIYQEYLNRYANSEDAEEQILEFLDQDDNQELLLNNNDQRILFIANNYRKEVTSTALWLLDHDIQLQCFRATPYSLSDELFLQIEQIIPLPETKEYMIDAKEKQKAAMGHSNIMVSLNYLRGLDVAELKEEDMPMI